MKIERIAPNKIKVTLSNDDLKEWDITFDSLTYNSPEAQDLFWNLIRRAEVEAGFYADGSQLVVEAMPGKNDGFIMIITKIDQDDDNPVHKYIKPKIKKELRQKKKIRVASNPLVFEFKSLDDVIQACKNIENRFSGDSSLYKYNEKYYLTFIIPNDFLAEDLDIMLTEFARKESTNPLIKTGELAEYAQLLVENNAVENLCTHF